MFYDVAVPDVVPQQAVKVLGGGDHGHAADLLVALHGRHHARLHYNHITLHSGRYKEHSQSPTDPNSFVLLGGRSNTMLGIPSLTARHLSYTHVPSMSIVVP